MSLLDTVGLFGVCLTLLAYALAQLRRLDPIKLPSLAMNFAGSSLIVLSLIHNFNLAAFIMEAAWAATALFGIVRRLLELRRT